MPEGSKAITTQDTVAKIELAEDEPYRAMYKNHKHKLQFRSRGDDNFEDEKNVIWYSLKKELAEEVMIPLK